MVKIENLRKEFKRSRKQMIADNSDERVKKAVDGISFEARPGEIFGLLGPNGAGKTTTLRCISTLLKPTDGSVFVGGRSTEKEAMEVRKRMAFLTNELKLDVHFTPEFTMEFFGQLHGMSEGDIHTRREQLFKVFDITKFRHVKIGELSTGMKQKLSIAVSLIHDPEVVVFDEPTNGLDIITAKTVTNYLEYLRDQGKTVILSTHIMTVSEKLCDRIGVLIDGRLRTVGNRSEILAETGTGDLEDAFFKLYKEVYDEE